MLRQWIKVHYVIILFCCIRKSIPVRHRAVYLRHIILCVYIIYLMWYIYIIIIYSLRRRVFVSVVRMRSYQYYIFCIIVSWLPTHTHRIYIFIVRAQYYILCVSYGYDNILLLLSSCIRWAACRQNYRCSPHSEDKRELYEKPVKTGAQKKL